MTAQWAPGGRAHAELLEDDVKKGLAAIVTGMGSLSCGGLAGERMKLGLMLRDPEEERDCFSDNTHNSHYYDALGVRNVYLGEYRRVDGSILKGPGLSALVAAASPAVDREMRRRLDATMTAMEEIVKAAEGGEAYDQMIGKGNKTGNARVQAAIDALKAQTRSIEKVRAASGSRRSSSRVQTASTTPERCSDRKAPGPDAARREKTAPRSAASSIRLPPRFGCDAGGGAAAAIVRAPAPQSRSPRSARRRSAASPSRSAIHAEAVLFRRENPPWPSLRRGGAGTAPGRNSRPPPHRPRDARVFSGGFRRLENIQAARICPHLWSCGARGFVAGFRRVAAPRPAGLTPEPLPRTKGGVAAPARSDEAGRHGTQANSGEYMTISQLFPTNSRKAK